PIPPVSSSTASSFPCLSCFNLNPTCGDMAETQTWTFARETASPLDACGFSASDHNDLDLTHVLLPPDR
ncbi:hypothetical protein S245_036588, partial [Arachis hypogaea]